VFDGCNDGFQYNEDDYDLPDGAIDYTDIQFMNLSWVGQIDTNNVECTSPTFASDYKSFHEPSDLLIWNITGLCADGVQSTTGMTQLSWLVNNLDQDYEIYMYIGENGTNMRFTTSVSINCEDLIPTYELVDGEWIYNTNIKVLIGGCASSGLTTFYLDDDGDGLGSNTYSQYCSGFEPSPSNTKLMDTDVVNLILVPFSPIYM
jgi:hypothetical protein